MAEADTISETQRTNKRHPILISIFLRGTVSRKLFNFIYLSIIIFWFGMFFAHITHSHWVELSSFRLIERHPEKDESRRRLALHVATLQRDRERGDNRTINFISLAGKRFETKQYQPWL